MIFISHRGNINGQKKELENNPDYILQALNLKYDVEIDVRYLDNKWYLGHDFAQYNIDISFLKNKNLWCHAKNLDALKNMLIHGINCFWHQEDNYTITSNGYIWTYPGNDLCEKSICVLPELEKQNFYKGAGICSDFIERYRVCYSLPYINGL